MVDGVCSAADSHMMKAAVEQDLPVSSARDVIVDQQINNDVSGAIGAETDVLANVVVLASIPRYALRDGSGSAAAFVRDEPFRPDIARVIPRSERKSVGRLE